MKKSKTLSEKINKLFASDLAKEQSDESGDETAPKFSEFDEVPDEAFNKDAALSEFRKRNVKFLEEFDQKYKGKVSSRKEASEDEDGSEGDDSDDEGTDESDADDYDDDGEDLPASKGNKKSILLLKPTSGDEDSDASASQDDEDEDESEDEKSEFTDYLAESNERSSASQITLIKAENREETVSKGLAIQNQLKLWERMLEVRIKMQPCVITANSLPSADMYEKLRTDSQEFRERADQSSQIVAETLDRLLTLQVALFEQFSETKKLLRSGSKRKAEVTKKSHKLKRIAVNDYEADLAGRASDMVEYRNNVLMKWHDRTKIASSVRNQKQSLSVLKKIEDSLINREDLIRKTQLYRGNYPLFGRAGESATARKEEHQQDEEPGEEGATPIYDGEIYDDSEFYLQLLRELIEYKTNTIDSPQEIANKLAELQKLRNKMKKPVDTRASKGRKIRYVLHKKLVNYMAPVPDHDWTDEAKDELFGSLFGRTPASDQ